MSHEKIPTTLPIVFNFGETSIRTVDRDGELWFVAKDVARVLGYDKTNHLNELLDEDEKGAEIVGTLGGAQKMSIISESGLYSAIAASRSPEAKPFKRWVNHDVLPAIRKTGSYGVLPDAVRPGQVEAVRLARLTEENDALRRELLTANPLFSTLYRCKAGGLSCAEAGRVVGKSANAVSKHLRRMSDLGLVERAVNGRCALPGGAS